MKVEVTALYNLVGTMSGPSKRTAKSRERTKDNAAPRMCSKYTFLDLPPEIRNKIYNFVFGERVVLISHGKKGKDVGYLHNIFIKKPFLPQKEHYESHHDKTGIDLVFTCKAIYGEALPLFYSKMAFGFNCVKTIRRFLYRTPSEALAAVTQIGVHQGGYSEPAYVSNILWKKKFDRAWIMIYHDINLLMPNLRYFALSLQVLDWPIKLRLDELWAGTILQLGSYRFCRVRVTIDSPMHPAAVVRRAEQDMLGELMMPEEHLRRLGVPLADVHPKWMHGDRFDTLSHMLGRPEAGIQNFPNMAAVVLPLPPLPKATRILRINFGGRTT